MTAFEQKRFSTYGPKRIDPKRDCAVMNHWPVLRKGQLVCWFCNRPCQSDGTDAREES